MNGLDNNIYSIGRGPSALTVSAPDSSSSIWTSSCHKRNSHWISQQVQQQDSKQQTSPTVFQCASDASMKDWMGYVYQQKPLPTNFTGVDVTINVVDANGNFRSIGTATTDYTGAYNLVLATRHSRHIQRHRNICRHQRLLAIICNCRIQRDGRTPNNSTSTNCSTING